MRSAPVARVVVYALADYSLAEHQTIETFSTREEAEAALREVLGDEPGWSETLKVVELELDVAEN